MYESGQSSVTYIFNDNWPRMFYFILMYSCEPTTVLNVIKFGVGWCRNGQKVIDLMNYPKVYSVNANSEYDSIVVLWPVYYLCNNWTLKLPEVGTNMDDVLHIAVYTQGRDPSSRW